MKIKKIKNQFDYVIYAIINIVIIVLMMIYNSNLFAIRLSELGFFIPIFIYFKIKSLKEIMPFFTCLPFLTEDNFFKIDTKSYKGN